MKVSGFGGYWVVAQEDTTAAIQHNASFDINLEAVTSDVQTSGNGGWIEGLPKACKLTSGFMKVYEDDEAYPEAVGFYIGQFLGTVWFRRGESEIYDAVNNTQVADVKYLNDQKRGRYLEIKIEYGLFQYFVTPPSTSEPNPPPYGGEVP